MAIPNLTSKAIEAAKPGKFVVRLRDGAVPGFHLLITPADSRSWSLAYTSPETGKRRFYPLGSYAKDKDAATDNCLTLKAARKRATEVRSLIDDEGIDPIEQDKRDAERARQATIEAETGTTKQLFELYIQNLEMDGKNRSALQIRNAILEKQGERDCGRLHPMKARDVTKDDIAGIKSKIAERAPVQANRVRTYLHAAFEFGLVYMGEDRWHRKFKAGEIPDFQLTSNPVSRIKRNAKVEQPRKRYLDKDEVVRVWNALSPDNFHSELSLAIKLLLSIGQRVEEVLQAPWSEFDADEMLWRIPAERRKTRNKNTVDHLVPLCDFHIKLLEELKQYTGSSVYLFPHKDGDRPRGADALSQAVYRFCRPGPESKREAFEPFVPKDCRRTFKTLAGSIGISLEMRNRLQGHAFQDVGSTHYDQWDYLDDKRDAMNKYCHWLDALVTGKKRGKVVQLRGAS